jgi:hypothetical protein
MERILIYIQALITQMGQIAACNRHHKLEQQLARWLLFFLDRSPTNELAITHQVIANSLGVRREGVTEAVGKLRDLGVIEHSRGHTRVVDRILLENMSCECYGVVKAETDRLFAGISCPKPDSWPYPCWSVNIRQ